MIKFDTVPFDKEKVFFTSDLHYGHKNISKDSVWDRPTEDDKCRPWSVDIMNNIIVDTINDTVPWDGLLVHLGDWSFGGKDNIVELRKQIHCEHIMACYGNHDHNIINNVEYQQLFTKIDHLLYIKVGHQEIICCHYPILSWHHQHKGVWNLYGHCHGNLQDNMNIKTLDVGFDTKLHGHQQYTLYSMAELERIMSLKGNVAVDHHV